MNLKRPETNPILISGPSGVGKTYLTQQLEMNFNCKRVVSTTTRKPRGQERHGVAYWFLSDIEYQEREASGAMFMSNQFLGARYGCETAEIESIRDIGLHPVTEIYTPKINEFMAAYPDSVAIFLMPSGLSMLIRNMKRRGDSPPAIRDRFHTGLGEILDYASGYKHYYQWEYVVSRQGFKRMLREIVNDLRLVPRQEMDQTLIYSPS